MSEGAGVLIFETEDHLRNRGGKAWAEVLSGSSTSDSFSLVRPDPQGTQSVAVIRNALEEAGLTGDVIADSTYVSAHGTSTRYNDAIETEIIKGRFWSSCVSTSDEFYQSMLGAHAGSRMCCGNGSLLQGCAGRNPPADHQLRNARSGM